MLGNDIGLLGLGGLGGLIGDCLGGTSDSGVVANKSFRTEINGPASKSVSGLGGLGGLMAGDCLRGGRLGSNPE